MADDAREGSGAVVRPASPDDAEELARLLAAFNAEYDAATPPVEVLARRYAALLAGSGFCAFLAFHPGNEASGFATLSLRGSVYADGPVALLEDLYVAPPLRDLGIGSLLMEAVLDRAARDRWGAVEIQVDEPDLDAMRFYARHGFTDRDPDSGDRAVVWWRGLERNGWL